LRFAILLLVGLSTVACEENVEICPGEENVDGFSLTISVENTTVKQGNNFKVNVELKNNREEDVIIVYGRLFWPCIPYWQLYYDYNFEVVYGISDPIIFPAGSVIRVPDPDSEYEIGLNLIGRGLKRGTHYLRYKASFYFDEYKYGLKPEIEVWSNTIVLTVK